MRRIRRLAALPLLVLLALVPGVTVAAAARAAAVPAASCTGTVQINSLTFSAPIVTPGQTATATVNATNCTAQPLSTTVQWYARFSDSSGNIPAGCPVVDPIAQQANFPAGGTFTQNYGVTVFSSCTATSVEVFVSFIGNGATLAQATATEPIRQVPTIACHVAYVKQSEWQGGFVAALTITNTGNTTIAGWRLTFTFGGDQHIGYVWGGERIAGRRDGDAHRRRVGRHDRARADGQRHRLYRHLAPERRRPDRVRDQRRRLRLSAQPIDRHLLPSPRTRLNPAAGAGHGAPTPRWPTAPGPPRPLSIS